MQSRIKEWSVQCGTHFDRNITTAVRSCMEDRITNMAPVSGSSNEEWGCLCMHSMTFLSCSHVRSYGEQQAMMEYRTDIVSALPELHTLSKFGKCSEGEIQVHGHTMGSAWASSVCVRSLPGESQVLVVWGVAEEGLWGPWSGKEAGVARVWRSALIVTRARPFTVTEEQTFLFILLQNP